MCTTPDRCTLNTEMLHDQRLKGRQAPKGLQHQSVKPTNNSTPTIHLHKAVAQRVCSTKGKEVCMVFVSGGVNYAYAGVVCAPPHGVRVRVRFRDGAMLLCKLDRMLAIVP